MNIILTFWLTKSILDSIDQIPDAPAYVVTKAVTMWDEWKTYSQWCYAKACKLCAKMFITGDFSVVNREILY